MAGEASTVPLRYPAANSYRAPAVAGIGTRSAVLLETESLPAWESLLASKGEDGS
jgi:hypothetical protein